MSRLSRTNRGVASAPHRARSVGEVARASERVGHCARGARLGISLHIRTVQTRRTARRAHRRCRHKCIDRGRVSISACEMRAGLPTCDGTRAQRDCGEYALIRRYERARRKISLRGDDDGSRNFQHSGVGWPQQNRASRRRVSLCEERFHAPRAECPRIPSGRNEDAKAVLFC